VFIIIILPILLFFYACTSSYTLHPCYKTKGNLTYAKVNIYKEAKLLLETTCDKDISLSLDSNNYSLLKEENIYISNEYLKKGLYKINPPSKNIKKASYVYDDAFIYKQNLKENKLKLINPGLTHNSLSACMGDTNDWFLINEKNTCAHKKYNISINTIYTDNINFEIIDAGISKGLLELNKVYAFKDYKELIIRVFFNKGSYIYPYIINVEELCYPNKNKVAVLSFVNQDLNTSVLIDAGADEGLSVGMNFFFIDTDSLKICEILSVTNNKAVCVFKGLLVKNLPKDIQYYEN